MNNITRRDLTEVFDRLPSSSPALPRNLFALLRKMFSWAVERGDIERSPFEQMKSPKSVKDRDRVLADDELRLVAVHAGELNAPFGAYVRMLLITGQRRDEVSGMLWSELDRDDAMWTIPSNRTKNGEQHSVPLNHIAIIELDELAGDCQWPRTGLVFTTTGRTPISGYSKVKMQLDRIIEARSGHRLPPWRFHDLRRTFATNMQKLRVRFEVTEALLNHVSGHKAGVAGIYQRHDWAKEKKQAVKRWAGKLRKMLAHKI